MDQRTQHKKRDVVEEDIFSTALAAEYPDLNRPGLGEGRKISRRVACLPPIPGSVLTLKSYYIDGLILSVLSDKPRYLETQYTFRFGVSRVHI